MDNTENNETTHSGDGLRPEATSQPQPETTPKTISFDRQEATPRDRQETAPLDALNRQETRPTTPYPKPTQPNLILPKPAQPRPAQPNPSLPNPAHPNQTYSNQTYPSQAYPNQTRSNQTQGPAPLHSQPTQHTARPNPYQQGGYPYSSVPQPQNYSYPGNFYTYGQPYHGMQAPTPQNKKWSTTAMILAALIALIFGALMGIGIGANIDNSNNNVFDDYSEYGSGPSSDDVDVPAVDSAPGILIINSMLNGGLGAGTGMIISSDGYAVTNYHVVEGSTSVQVTVSDTGEKYNATVLGYDATVDIAVLQLQGAENLDYIEFDTATPKKGESVYVFGNAEGQGYLSELTGKITALNQDITAVIDGGGAEKLTGLIQTDADVVQGCSGGPMYNDSGKVIGVIVATSTSRWGSEEINGYAIPAKDVTKIIEQIKTGQSKGTTKVGANAALGISVRDDSKKGANIVQVNRGSAAEKAGLEVGDTITALNGKSITSASDLSKMVKTFSIGDTVKVTYIDSSGKEKTVEAELGESPVN